MDETQMDPQLARILPKVLAMSLEAKLELIDYLKASLAKNRETVKPDPEVSSIGLFADEPGLADEISRQAMEAREAEASRAAHE